MHKFSFMRNTICMHVRCTVITMHTICEGLKMNKIINKFLLTGDNFMPELHLKQPGFTYSTCEPFTKHRERIQLHNPLIKKI